MAEEETKNSDMNRRMINLEKEVKEIKDTIIYLSKTVKLMQEIMVSEREEYKDFDWEKATGG